MASMSSVAPRAAMVTRLAVGYGRSASSSTGNAVSNLANSNLKMWQHKGVRWICGGWVLFVGENLILSENRSWIIDRYSERTYHYGYNTLSSIACGSIAYGFLKHGRRKGPLLFASNAVPAPLRLAGAGCIAMGLVGFSQMLPTLRNPLTVLQAIAGIDTHKKGDTVKQNSPTEVLLEITDGQNKAVTPVVPKKNASLCPMDFQADREMIAQFGTMYGVSRITRNPSLWSFGLVGLGCALRTPFAAEACFFLGPFFTVAILTEHKDSRYRRGIGGSIEYPWPQSCNVPFATVFAGHHGLMQVVSEMKGTNAMLAMLLASLMLLRRGKVPMPV